MTLYSSEGCLNGNLSQVQWNDSLSDYQLIGDPCTVDSSVVIGSSDLNLARWIGVGLLIAYTIHGAYKLVVICKQQLNKLRVAGIKSPGAAGSFVHSAPFMAHGFLTAFNIALLLTLSDPNGKFDIFPDLFRAFLVCVMAYSIFALLVIVVYKMWYSILVEFDQELLKASSQPFLLRIMFLQLLVASILIAFPTKLLVVRALQSLILVGEAIFFAAISLYFGCKLHSRLTNHQSQIKADYSRALTKIRILLLGSLIAITVSIIVNMRSAISLLMRYESKSAPTTGSKIRTSFWMGIAFLYFMSTLINLIAFLVFRANKNAPSKTATRRSTSRRKPEVSPVNVDSGSILNSTMILAVPDNLPVSPTSIKIDLKPDAESPLPPTDAVQ